MSEEGQELFEAQQRERKLQYYRDYYHKRRLDPKWVERRRKWQLRYYHAHRRDDPDFMQDRKAYMKEYYRKKSSDPVWKAKNRIAGRLRMQNSRRKLKLKA